MHEPVLKNEILQFFQRKQIKLFIDGTLGAGGHASALLESHPEIEHYIGIDQDPEAIAIARNKLIPWEKKVNIHYGNFASVVPKLLEQSEKKIDGILLDLGVSSMQLDRPEKGFSFMREGPLDMRMDPNQSLTAADIVNTWDEKALGKIFRDYGEEKFWRKAAAAIVTYRKDHTIQTTLELSNLLQTTIPKGKQKIHPATRIFQAIRICVNSELDVIENVLPHCVKLLKKEGILCVISFHSLEDRIVKTCFKEMASDKTDTKGLGGGLFMNKEPTVNLLTRKPIEATDEEIFTNPRSRCAKLRVIEKR